MAERRGELALHVVRGIIWLVIFSATAMLLQLPLLLALGDGALLALIWVIGLAALIGSGTFGIARYVLTIADPLLVVGAVATVHGPIAPLLPNMSPGADLEQVVRTHAPPLLLFLALSGSFRLDPRLAGLAAILAATTFIFYGVRFAIPTHEWALLGLIAVSGIVATTMSRVLRYLSFRALEREALEDYVPEAAERELTLTGQLAMDGRIEDVTLLLCDIRGFTRISEKMTPEETVGLVNAYLDAVCPPIVASGGVIDKFMGDGVLAFFEGGGHAGRGVYAARQVVKASEGVAAGGIPLRIGVALHSGEVLVGAIGPRTRREYTIISDAVNTLTRLEELNKVYGSRVVASAMTVASLDPAERDDFEGPLDVAIRGRDAGISVYVMGASAVLGDQDELDERLRTFVERED